MSGGFVWDWQSVLGIVGLLAIVILIHELAHFWLGRRFNMGVSELAVGFGPKLWSTQRGEITYSVRMLPLGGFVRFYEQAPGHRPVTWQLMSTAPWGQRFVVIAGGGVANLVLAALAFMLVLSLGSAPPVLSKASPLLQSGVASGVNVVAINGKPTPGFDSQIIALQATKGSLVAVTLKPWGGGAEEVVKVHPYLIWAGAGKIPYLAQIVKVDGVSPAAPQISYTTPGSGANVPITIEYRVGLGKTHQVSMPTDETKAAWTLGWNPAVPNEFIDALSGPPRGLPEAIWGGVVEVPLGIGNIFHSLFQVIIPSIIHHSNHSNTQVVGPVGVAVLASQASQQSFALWLTLLGLLSLNLGVLNLLPLPFVDGGHLGFLAIERIRGRKASPRVEKVVHLVGLVLIAALLVALTYGDIGRLIHP